MIAKRTLASVATILFALALQSANAEYDVAHYCELVPTGTKLPSGDSCQTYYSCNAFGAQPSTFTCGNGQVFDKDYQGCTSNGNCYKGNGEPCQNKNLVYVPNANDCAGWIWCVNSVEKGSGRCPAGQLFDSTSSACVYGTCTNDDEGNNSGDVQNVCSIMQNGQYFGAFDDCTEWNVCSNSAIVSGNCDPGLVYNTQRRMCLKNDGTMCERTNGNVPVVPTAPCGPANKFAKIGDANVCAMWYICDGTQWVKQTECGPGLYFDTLTSSCKNRQAATPTAGCNRCQYSSSTFVNAVDPFCQDYIYCKGGVEVSTGTCDAGQFFNEKRQACVVGTNDFDTYKSNNGACYGDTSTTVEDDSTTEGTTEETTTEETTTEETTTKDPADEGAGAGGK